MRSIVRIFLALLAVTFIANFASANDFEFNQHAEVLADILSPDELLAEMGPPTPPSEIPVEATSVRLFIKVDKSLQGTSPTAQTMEIYLDGQLLNIIQVSTGREKDELAKSGRTYFSRTPTGTFKIYRRSRKHFSHTWQAPMPFAQFFNGGIAIHATSKDHYEELGTRASGGCVRVTYENAEMIWNLVEEIGVDQTLISVVDTGI